ncbi:MAG: hypothetical protein QNK04_24720 [Myxococcota bacterium]|nr:hypothetical protein [Myxococcota bacterium]
MSGLDIFVASGASQYERLRALLPRLRPHGRLHVVSSFLGAAQLAALAGEVDALHQPRHSENAYGNFVLFFIRDAHRLATSRYLLKIDTDVELAPDWFDYVEESLAAHPQAVLVGSHAGTNQVDYDISGALVRQRLGRDVRVRGMKANGSFCLVDLDFFRRYDRTFQDLHDFIFAFHDGRRARRSHLDDPGAEEPGPDGDLVRLRGVCANRQGTASYDNLLSLTAHFLGAGNQVIVRQPGNRIQLPDKRIPPSILKRIGKRLRARAGLPWRPSPERAHKAAGSSGATHPR